MIQFVIVNGQAPARAPFVCAACGKKLDHGYIHKRSANRKYCTRGCFRPSPTCVEITRRAYVALWGSK
jgi:hypothetical protein